MAEGWGEAQLAEVRDMIMEGVGQARGGQGMEAKEQGSRKENEKILETVFSQSKLSMKYD